MSPEKRPNYPSKPLRPSEVLATKAETFPEEVFIAVNGLIIEKLHGQYAQFSVKALTRRLVELGLEEKEAKERGWIKVGSIYKEAGWDVSYHSPDGEGRDFDPYYTFDTKSQRSW